MWGSPRCIFAWVLSWSTHTLIGMHVASWPSRGLYCKMGPESHMMNALPHFYWHSVTGTARKSRWILSKYLPCLHSFQARPEADQLLNRSSRFCWIFLFHVRRPKIHLCMSSKLKYTYLNRYACSKLAQQRLMRQGGPRVTVTYYECPAAFLSTFSHWHSQKKQMNLVQVCHASTLSRLGWIIQDFVEYFRTVSHEC